MNLKPKDYSIATLGSHTALQIAHGAQQEGSQSTLFCEKDRMRTYRSMARHAELVEVDAFRDILEMEERLLAEQTILIPHGSWFNAMSLSELRDFKALYFGNKHILPWETDRNKQREWLSRAGLTLPKMFSKPRDINTTVIVKFFGAHGGKGFFLARTPESFDRRISAFHGKNYVIQQYIIGIPIYIHYFYSPLTKEVEIMSCDQRKESNVDSVGRIGAADQIAIELETSYNVVGNTPIVLRESLLEAALEMGEKVIEASQKIEPGGLIGPFCLECVVTPDLQFIVFEISARIVAGTNPYINGSPYTDLRYEEPMSTGRRIAREIKMAIEQDRLDEILVNSCE